MSSRLLIAPCVLAFGMSVVAAQQTVPAAVGTGVISGWVVDTTSGLPIAEASVTLRSVGRIDAAIDAAGKVTVIPHPVVTTDAQGQFAFSALRVGTYTVTATIRNGFVQGSAYLELDESQQVTDVTVRLSRYGSIAGTVRDEHGDPIVGMRVDAFQKRTTGFKPSLFPRGGVASDDRGQFRIGDLPPGEYLICACGREPLSIDKRLLPLLGAASPSATAVTRRMDASVPAFAMTFHPGSTLASEAVAVVVGSADDKADIDISVGAVTPRRVSGQLTGLGANSAAGLTLLLIPANDLPEAEALTAIESVSVTPQGAFDFVAVPPGEYSLEAYPTDGKAGLWASVPVGVGEQDVAGLSVPLGAGGTVTGRIEFSGGTQRPDAATLEKARVLLAPVDFTPRVMISAGASGSVGHSSAVGSDGSFRIEGVPPGRYLAMAMRLGPEWQITESIRTSAGTSIEPVVTTDETGLSGLAITMSSASPAMLLGTVELDRYESPQTVNVVLFPVDSEKWPEASLSPGRFAVASVSNAKTFRFSGVPEGDYFAMLVPTETNMGPEQLEIWSRTATRVSLKAGENTTIALRR